MYVCPPVSETTCCRNAALGEKVPAKPPDSFQPSGCPAVVGNEVSVTTMPMSWLKPALAVKRSALAPVNTWQSTVGVKARVNENGSMTCQVLPLLLVSEYCWVLTLSIGALAVGKNMIDRRVGENLLTIGPAPATIWLVPEWFVFHCSLIVYEPALTTGSAACTKAAFGLNVPANPPDSFQASGCPAVLG